MITGIQIRNFRGIKHLQPVELSSFQIRPNTFSVDRQTSRLNVSPTCAADWTTPRGALAPMPSVIIRELEEWPWHNPASLAKLLTLSQSDLERLRFDCTRASLLEAQPKELFEEVFYRCHRRRPRPGDFGQVAATASLTQWQNSDSFQSVVRILRTWFPPRA